MINLFRHCLVIVGLMEPSLLFGLSFRSNFVTIVRYVIKNDSFEKLCFCLLICLDELNFVLHITFNLFQEIPSFNYFFSKRNWTILIVWFCSHSYQKIVIHLKSFYLADLFDHWHKTLYSNLYCRYFTMLTYICTRFQLHLAKLTLIYLV